MKLSPLFSAAAARTAAQHSRTMRSIPVPESVLSTTGPPVGVRYFGATEQHPPLRVFYPASSSTIATTKQQRRPPSVGWFSDTGLFPYLQGYVRMSLGREFGLRRFRQQLLWNCIVVPCLRLLSWILPVGRQRLPNVYQNAPTRSLGDHDPSETTSQSSSGPFPFSHGLTGTGQENALLCAAWAQRGYVVANVHHTEGSACFAPLANGTTLPYQHPPPFVHYDPNFRPNQITIRAQQLQQAFDFLTRTTSDSSSNSQDHDQGLSELQRLMDPSQGVLAAGFSYGAATVARALMMPQSPFTAALFLDGWFHIDTSSMVPGGTEFNFPPPAFDHGQTKGALPSHVPTLFLNSQQFANYTKLYKATQLLAECYKSDSNTKQPTNIVILPDTGHQSFCDVVFWLPPWVLNRFLKGALGAAEPIGVYDDIVQRTCAFFHEVVTNPNKKDSGVLETATSAMSNGEEVPTTSKVKSA